MNSAVLSAGDLKSKVVGLIASKLHQFWGHWDTEFLGHTRDLVNVWLGTETSGKSVERSLSIHQSLQLASWVIVLDVALILSLLLSSLGISISDSLIHLSLHLSGLLSGILNTWKIVTFDLDGGDSCEECEYNKKA